MEQKGILPQKRPTADGEAHRRDFFADTQIWKKAERFVPFTLWTDLGLPNNSWACQVFCVSFKKKFYGRENLPIYIIHQFNKLLQ